MAPGSKNMSDMNCRDYGSQYRPSLLEIVINKDYSTWLEWAEIYDIENHSSDEFNIFPALYLLLNENSSQHEWLPRLRGVMKRTWIANQKVLSASRNAQNVLSAAHIDSINSPFVQLYHSGLSCPFVSYPTPRITVRWEDSLNGLIALHKSGWKVKKIYSHIGDIAKVIRLNSWTLISSEGHVIILTNHYIKCQRGRLDDRKLWLHAISRGNVHEYEAEREHMYLGCICHNLSLRESSAWMVVFDYLHHNLPISQFTQERDILNSETRKAIINKVNCFCQLIGRLDKVEDYIGRFELDTISIESDSSKYIQKNAFVRNVIKIKDISAKCRNLASLIRYCLLMLKT